MIYYLRCRHGSAIYFPEPADLNREYGYNRENLDIYDSERAKAAYIENQIQKYKRLRAGSIAPENLQMYKARLQEWGQKKVDNCSKNVIISFENKRAVDEGAQMCTV